MGVRQMNISQLYGEILGNTKGVTWEESETINTWYSRAINGHHVVDSVTYNVVKIYDKRTMDFRDHIVQGILETY